MLRFTPIPSNYWWGWNVEPSNWSRIKQWAELYRQEVSRLRDIKDERFQANIEVSRLVRTCWLDREARILA